MFVTEDEAKTKRCQEGFAAAAGLTYDGAPMHQVGSSPTTAYGGAGTFTAVATGGAPINCVASGCMAWRWGDHRYKGYCGKAGKPDEKHEKIEALTTRYVTGQFSECVYRASLMHLIPPDEIRHLIMLNQAAHRCSTAYKRGDVT